MAGCIEGSRRPLVQGLVLIEGTAIEQAPSVGPLDNSFPSVVFGMAPGVLKEQYDNVLDNYIRSIAPERILVEGDVPIVGERRTCNHPWTVSTILARVAFVKVIPIQIIAKLIRDNFFLLFFVSIPLFTNSLITTI